jgi:hypothetical protein
LATPTTFPRHRRGSVILDDLGDSPRHGVEELLRIGGRLGERSHRFQKDAEAFFQPPTLLGGVR